MAQTFIRLILILKTFPERSFLLPTYRVANALDLQRASHLRYPGTVWVYPVEHAAKQHRHSEQWFPPTPA